MHWDGIEYWDPKSGKGAVFAFRGSANDVPEHRFILAGLDSSKRYRLHFEDGSSLDRLATGAELMSAGVNVHLALPLSSELVFIQSAERPAR